MTMTGNEVSHVKGSDVTGSQGSTFFPRFPALFSYYSSSTKCSTVVQVPWLPDERMSRDPEGVPFGEVCACATGSCAISALVEFFHRK